MHLSPADARLLASQLELVERAGEAARELDDLGARSEVVTEAILRLAAAQVKEIRVLR